MFFFSSFRFSARMCPFVCGRKTIDFSVVVQTGRAQKCGGGGGGGPPVAREKKRRRKSRRVHSLAREVAELFRARPSRPEWFFRFPEGRLVRKTEDKFCASAGFIFFLSRLLKEPAWSYKRGGKTRVDIRKRKRIDDEDSRNPLFFFGTKTNNRPSSRPRRWLQPPSSPRKRPTRRKTSSRKSPKANRCWSTSPGARFCPPFRSRWRSSCGDDRACKREREEK